MKRTLVVAALALSGAGLLPPIGASAFERPVLGGGSFPTINFPGTGGGGGTPAGTATLILECRSEGAPTTGGSGTTNCSSSSSTSGSVSCSSSAGGTTSTAVQKLKAFHASASVTNSLVDALEGGLADDVSCADATAEVESNGFACEPAGVGSLLTFYCTR